MNHTLIHVILVLISSVIRTCYAAPNLIECLADMNDTVSFCAKRHCSSPSCDDTTAFDDCLSSNFSDPEQAFNLSDLRFSNGTSIINPFDGPFASGISYSVCKTRCGGTPEQGSWSTFAQSFSAWVIPWLALLSQLPFGCQNRIDNILGVLLTVGSPTLAAYSVVITVLNGRWITHRFRRIRNPSESAKYALRVIRSLQQSPLVLSNKSNLLSSLVVLPKNKPFWAKLTERLDGEASTWSVPAAASIMWVIIADVFTIAISFSDIADSLFSVNGQAIGSAWCWLVAVVACWLQISPKCNEDRISKWIQYGNRKAYVVMGPNESPVRAQDALKGEAALSLRSHDSLYHDQLCSQPIFNYSRFLPWTEYSNTLYHYFDHAASETQRQGKMHVRTSSDRNQESERNDDADNTREIACNFREIIAIGDRSFDRPSRLADFLIASFSALCLQWGTTVAAIIAFVSTPTTGIGCRSITYILYGILSTLIWLMLVVSSYLAYFATPPMVTSHLNLRAGLTFRRDRGQKRQASANEQPQTPISPSSTSLAASPLSPRFPPGIPMTEFYHSCSVDEEALRIEEDTAEEQQQKTIGPLTTRASARFISIWLRRIANFLAVINALGFIVVCILQFSNQLDNCYCNSSVIGRGIASAYAVVTPLRPSDSPGHEATELALSTMKNAYIAAVCLSSGCAIAFIFFVSFMMRSSDLDRQI